MTPDINQLYKKFLKKECSPEELRQLLQYFRTSEGDRRMENLIGTEMDKPIQEDEYRTVDHFQVARERDKLLHIIRPASVKRSLAWLWSAAAVILVLMSVGIYWSQQTDPDTRLLSRYGNDVAPGMNRATVTLSDGTVVELDENRIGIVADTDGLSYMDGSQIAHTDQTVEYATLSTPRGGQYQLTLPDGTRAWVNAASSITYPTRFTDQQRVIVVTGEVFLDVVHNPAIPFIVESNQQRIEVLGTSFNMDTYGDSGHFMTTLIEGKLRITDTSNKKSLILQPGQQVTLSPGNDMTIREIDTESVISWKNGVYSIHEQPLSQFAKHLARWYDIEIDMGPYGDIRLSVITSRNAPLSGVLEAIELKTGIKFMIKGRRVIAIE